jgi:hypothetical protein
MVRVRITLDALGFAAHADCRAVAPPAFGVDFTINLDEHGVVDIVAERCLDCGQIRFQPIGRQLHAVSETARKIFHEIARRLRVSLAKHEARRQLRIRVDCNPRPDIPRLFQSF